MLLREYSMSEHALILPLPSDIIGLISETGSLPRLPVCGFGLRKYWEGIEEDGRGDWTRPVARHPLYFLRELR